MQLPACKPDAFIAAVPAVLSIRKPAAENLMQQSMRVVRPLDGNTAVQAVVAQQSTEEAGRRSLSQTTYSKACCPTGEWHHTFEARLCRCSETDI